ncbi:hypothetical protein DL96DRAFT_653193 [Flagelloscypha sp. PMI_526]|nr:hypothetical protein DL96DRAFT_653193 [Flagelloscypha sp. PMI_526]
MSINGVTYSQSTYHDAQGNVHVKDVGPDGREVYTINGVPQNAIQPGSSQSHRRIEDYPTSRDRHSSSHRRHSSRQSSSGEKRDSHKSRDRMFLFHLPLLRLFSPNLRLY